MTPEQQQRVEQIEENRRIWYGGMGELTKDFDDLLSIVNEWESHREGLIEAVTTAEHAAENAATSICSACIEKVRSMRESWLASEKNHLDAHGECASSKALREHYSAAQLIIKALESVSIQEQK